MGSVNAYWYDSYWNDINISLHIDADLIHNNNNRTFRKAWWWLKSIQHNNQAETFGGAGFPASHAWRLPAGYTFAFLGNCYNYSGFMSDRCNWGTFANDAGAPWDVPVDPWATFPYPPTPPQPGAPAIYVSDAGVNRWNVSCGDSGATHHYLYIYDPVNGEPLYAQSASSNSGNVVYQLPAPYRSATVRGRSQNIGAAGAGSAVSDSFYTLSSENSFPTAPTPVAFDKTRMQAGGTARLSWTHRDPNGDAQKWQHVQYQKAPGGAWVDLGGVNTANAYRDITFTVPGTYLAQVRTADYEDSYGPWSASAQIIVYKTAVYQSGNWVDAVEDYVRSAGAFVTTKHVKLPFAAVREPFKTSFARAVAQTIRPLDDYEPIGFVPDPPRPRPRIVIARTMPLGLMTP